MSNLEALVKKLEADIEMIVTTVRGLVTVEEKTAQAVVRLADAGERINASIEPRAVAAVANASARTPPK